LCQIRHFGERKEKKKEVKDEEVEREALWSLQYAYIRCSCGCGWQFNGF
jgi:hypothetical protein